MCAGSQETHAAPIAMLSHFKFLLGEMKRRDEPDSLDSAISIKALAARRSRRIYMKLVKIVKRDWGINANRGSSRGACREHISNSFRTMLQSRRLT